MSVAAEKLNKQMIVALADRWPKCFPVSAQRRRSLKQCIESRHGWLESEIDDWLLDGPQCGRRVMRSHCADCGRARLLRLPVGVGCVLTKPLKPDRPYYIVAGPVISANVYHCASLALDPDTARRVDAANDWRRIKREIAWGWHEPPDPSLMVSQSEPCVPSSPAADGLSIPDFLRRVAS